MGVVRERRFYLQTLGCKVNWCDSDAFARAARSRGWVQVGRVSDAQVALVNTCTVTGHADATARKVIRALHRANPSIPLIVAGCYARTDAASVAQVCEGVHVVPGLPVDATLALMEQLAEAAGEQPHGAKGEPDLATGETLGVRSCDSMRGSSSPVALAPGRTRAFIKIQDGCDQRCAYCKVPLARGPSRSVPVGAVLQQVEARAAEGFREIVLTGVNMALYRDGTTGLAGLLRAVAGLGMVPRIRLSSVEATAVDECLLAVFAAHPSVVPHIHMPLQSGSPRVLARMQRVVTREQFCAAAREFYRCRPDGVITTDVLVGFPGETPADVAETRAVIEEIGFGKVHVFPFSPRPGTAAAAMPGRVRPAEVRAREAEIIRAAAEAARRCRERFLGVPLPVLIEQQRDGWWEGFSHNYLRVRTRRRGVRPGDIVELTVNQRDTLFVFPC
ncbi:MAG: tRNA (N(6)-L-threonylcarbamoyladenosine(37)-C(2))-methylthiotransferase MtaB [bacterium]|nr:tRNA (N(6)-L-threonylcarbamoyladenosine(37)-C(2))-methylthiotransferase MtaB [bacterium]